MARQTNISAIAQARGVQMQALARLVRCRPETMSRYASGKAALPLDKALAIAGALEVDLSLLIGKPLQNERRRGTSK
jgi:transcriptional regulator with XRE-family HTH domain